MTGKKEQAAQEFLSNYPPYNLNKLAIARIRQKTKIIKAGLVGKFITVNVPLIYNRINISIFKRSNHRATGTVQK